MSGEVHEGDKPRSKGLLDLDRQEAAERADLNPKDRVRVTFESDYGDVALAMWHNRPLMQFATVEVLERADDPFKDPVGTVRESDGRPYAKKAADHWVLIGEDRDYGDRCYDRQMANVHAQVIGSVPGTPAAEAEKPAPSSHESHCKDLAEAIYASHIYPWEELLFTARRYATHAIRDEQAAAREDNPEVSGAGVPYPPELWTGDGSEEPPSHVLAVGCAKGTIERRGDRWWWTVYAGEHAIGDPAEGSWSWTNSLAAEGPFKQVRP